MNSSGNNIFSEKVNIEVRDKASVGANDLGALDEQSTENLKRYAFDRAQNEDLRVATILRLGSRKVIDTREKLLECLSPNQPLYGQDSCPVSIGYVEVKFNDNK